MPRRRNHENYTEVLINLVIDNPSIYDITRPDHNDLIKKTNIWESISK